MSDCDLKDNHALLFIPIITVEKFQRFMNEKKNVVYNLIRTQNLSNLWQTTWCSQQHPDSVNDRDVMHL